MLYSILQITPEPIFIVQVKTYSHDSAQIYAIDETLLHLTAYKRGPIYRIDDLTRLNPHQFTLSDARHWFGGPIREDASWRSNVQHIAVLHPDASGMIARLQQEGTKLYVPVFPSMREAIQHTRIQWRNHP